MRMFQTSVWIVVVSLMCGIEPITPIGCINGKAVCVCDQDKCWWIWTDCQN